MWSAQRKGEAMRLKSVVKSRSVLTSVSRPGAATTADGYRRPGADTVITMYLYIQPMSLKELRNVPEGQNTLSWFNVWSVDPVLVKDKITYNGINYTVQRAIDRPEGGFYRAQAVKVSDTL